MFVQIVEGRTTDGKALMERGESWQQELRPGANGYLGVTAGVTAEGRAVTIARFESEDARPRQQRAARAGRVVGGDGEALRRRADVHRVERRHAVDGRRLERRRLRAGDEDDRRRPGQLEEMDKAFEPYTGARPDLLGGFRIWTGKDSCIDVAYFTSEAEARDGEKAEMPPEVQELMAGMQEGMGQVEYFDLTEPQVR